MSIRTFLAGDAGETRAVALGAVAAVALVAAAALGWWSVTPRPGDPVTEQGTTTPETMTAKPTEAAPVEDDPPAPVAEASPAEAQQDPTPDPLPTEEANEVSAGTTPEGDGEAAMAEAPEASGAEAVPPTETAQTERESGDATVPAVPAPAVPAPAVPAQVVTPPEFDVVRVDDSGEAVIAGRAAAGDVVRILLDGVAVAETAADASGAFVALVSLDPSQDPRTLTLESTGADGQTSLSDQTALVAPVQPVPVADAAAGTVPEPTETVQETADLTTGVAEVPQPPSDAPSAPDPAEEETQLAALEPVTEPESPAVPASPTPEAQTPPAPASPSVVIVAPDGAVPQSPAAAPARPDAPETANVVIDTVSYDATGEVILVGRAQPGNFVRLYLDNILTETIPVPEDGTWRSRVEGIDAGVYTLRADETDARGRVASRFETPFERVTRPVAIAAVEQNEQRAAAAEDSPLKASAGLVTVQPGFTLWAIARENYGDGVQYVRVFDANRSQIRDPDLIYPGQIFEIPQQ